MSRYGYDEDEPGFIVTMALGLLVLVALAVIITIPGWVMLPFGGWDWFVLAIPIFWGGALCLLFLGTLLYALGGGDI